MSNGNQLKSSTMLSSSALYQRQLLDALVNGAAEREEILKVLLATPANDSSVGKGPSNDNAKGETRWQRLRENKEQMSVNDLAAGLKALGAADGTIDAALLGQQRKTPLQQQAFYKALQEGLTNVAKIKAELGALRDEAKKQKGYVSKAFNVFSRKRPLDAVLENVASFEQYCHKNGITFDEVSQQMVAGEKPKTVWDKVGDFRFLIAAAGGAVMGLGGVNVAAQIPVLAGVPGTFFAGLPYIAVPFMGLSIFRAFAEKNVSQEAETFARFGVMMLSGFLIGAGVVTLMAGMLPHLAVAGAGVAAVKVAAGAAGFSPFHYIMQVMAGGAIGSGLYKMAKEKVKPADERAAAWAKKSKLAKTFNMAALPFVNRFTAPAIVKAGQFAEKAAGFTDKAFGGYMNYVGAPAVFLMMSTTFSHGIGAVMGYAGYYATVFTGMAIGAAALAVVDYLYGARRLKDAKAIGTTLGTAFGTSSGIATMPTTKESLKVMGVPQKTRDSVVPLSANFNMLGTSLYLGTTVFAANAIFGHTMDLMHKVAVAAIVALHGYGAPGMPSSNLSLLAPVLGLTGLSNAAIQKVYDMVIPGDRILDMSQTAINVWGDMTIALGKHRREVRRRAKRIKKIRDKLKAGKKVEAATPSSATAQAAAVPGKQPAPKNAARPQGPA